MHSSGAIPLGGGVEARMVLGCAVQVLCLKATPDAPAVVVEAAEARGGCRSTGSRGGWRGMVWGRAPRTTRPTKQRVEVPGPVAPQLAHGAREFDDGLELLMRDPGLHRVGPVLGGVRVEGEAEEDDLFGGPLDLIGLDREAQAREECV